MDGKIVIREYEPADKEAVMELLRLNTPRYFAPEEAADLDAYLERERELYYVLLHEERIVGCGGINFADGGTVGMTPRRSRPAISPFNSATDSRILS